MQELPARKKSSSRKKMVSPAPSGSPDVWGNADDEFFTSVRKGKKRAYSLGRDNVEVNHFLSGPHITDTNSSEGVEEWAYEDDLGAGMDEDGDVGFDEEEDNMILAMSKCVSATPASSTVPVQPYKGQRFESAITPLRKVQRPKGILKSPRLLTKSRKPR
jgi:hypothetical protein